MGKLDSIKFKGNGYDFLEEMDVYGIQQIKELTKTVIGLKFDDYESCCVLLDVLEEKVFEFDKCFRRILHEIYGNKPEAEQQPEHAE